MSWLLTILALISTPSSDSIKPFYYDDPWREVVLEAPWVIAIDDTINFLFYMHDCDEDPINELHAIAIYNLTDEEHHYYWAGRSQCAPAPNIVDAQ